MLYQKDIEWIYEKLPKIATVFITPKETEQIIESVLEYERQNGGRTVLCKVTLPIRPNCPNYNKSVRFGHGITQNARRGYPPAGVLAFTALSQYRTNRLQIQSRTGSDLK